MNPKVILKDYNRNFYSKRKRLKDDIYFWINSTFSILIWVLVILFIYYIWILNTNATQGYNIRTLELQKQNLLLQQELLEVKISNLESIRNIEKNSSDLSNIMEEVEDPNFIVIKNGVSYAYNN